MPSISTAPTRPAQAQPLLIAPGNAREMTGLPWRWLRDHVAELGVPVLRVDGKSMIPARELLAALRCVAAKQATAEPISDASERAEMRARLGLRRVAP